MILCAHQLATSRKHYKFLKKPTTFDTVHLKFETVGMGLYGNSMYTFNRKTDFFSKQNFLCACLETQLLFLFHFGSHICCQWKHFAAIFWGFTPPCPQLILQGVSLGFNSLNKSSVFTVISAVFSETRQQRSN